MKNLENSALMQEMNVNEMQEVNGGWVALALAVAGAAITVSTQSFTRNSPAPVKIPRPAPPTAPATYLAY